MGAVDKQKPTALAQMSRVERRHFESIRRWIYEHVGLFYPERKHLLLYHRLKKLCWRTGIPTFEALDEHLHARDLPGLASELACAISTNHSYFFREERIIHFFRAYILPALPPKGQWRVWSAACASGEEAYTLAIVLAEALGLDEAQQRVAILGTDIDRAMVEQAEGGMYHEQRLSNVPRPLFRRYFRPANGSAVHWRVDDGLRDVCMFRRLNLKSTPWPFKHQFHVVLCRNVLYYFDREHQRALVERVYDATLPGGWLITSVTEPVQSLDTRWQTVVSGVYRKM